MELSEEAKEAKKAYQRAWRAKNRESYNEYMKQWRKDNPGKVKEYQNNYWERKAEEMKQQ